MTIVRWRPFRDLVSIQDEMNRLFGDFFDRRPARIEWTDGMWSPSVDLSEDKDNVIIKAEMPGMKKDDRMHADVEQFRGTTIVVTTKMDGENTTMYRDGIHARSLDYKRHPSRDWVKNLHGKIAHEIPEGFRICGENLFAKHSIHYTNLPSYFMVFSVWDRCTCLAWENGLPSVVRHG